MLQYLWSDKKIKKDIKICKDFIFRSKPDLVKEYLDNGGTVEEIKNNSFSCYTPVKSKECMDCYPCFRKFAILYSLGCKYDDDTLKQMKEYVIKNIIPTKEQGGYQGTYYTERGEESEYLIKAVDKLTKEVNNE